MSQEIYFHKDTFYQDVAKAQKEENFVQVAYLTCQALAAADIPCAWFSIQVLLKQAQIEKKEKLDCLQLLRNIFVEEEAVALLEEEYRVKILDAIGMDAVKIQVSIYNHLEKICKRASDTEKPLILVKQQDVLSRIAQQGATFYRELLFTNKHLKNFSAKVSVVQLTNRLENIKSSLAIFYGDSYEHSLSDSEKQTLQKELEERCKQIEEIAFVVQRNTIGTESLDQDIYDGAMATVQNSTPDWRKRVAKIPEIIKHERDFVLLLRSADFQLLLTIIEILRNQENQPRLDVLKNILQKQLQSGSNAYNYLRGIEKNDGVAKGVVGAEAIELLLETIDEPFE